MNMTDNEFLLALSEMIDRKLDTKLKPIEVDLKTLKEEQTRINLIIENEMRCDIKLLAENYAPAAKRYEKAGNTLETMLCDIELLKKVVTEHSEKLQQIS